MRVIGLTGNIAAGKSAVVALLREQGAYVIEADAIVHELQRAGEPVFKAIVAQFSQQVVAANGELDRAALRAIMLATPDAKTALEMIVHPAVARRERELLTAAEARGEKLVIIDIPLLFETGQRDRFEKIILVDAPESVRRQRLISDRGITPVEADRLIASQLPSEKKRPLADWVIENSGTREALSRTVNVLWRQLNR